MTLDASMVAAIDEYGQPRGKQIIQDLRRYYRLLAEGRSTLRTRLSTAQLSLILEACNGWRMDPEAPGHLWIQVAEEIRRKALDLKWAVPNAPGLIRRLQELTWLDRSPSPMQSNAFGRPEEKATTGTRRRHWNDYALTRVHTETRHEMAAERRR